MKNIILSLILIQCSLVFGGNNSIVLTEIKATEFGSDNYEITINSALSPNPKADIALRCNKDGYRVHKIGDIDISSENKAVYYHNNFSLGTFLTRELMMCVHEKRNVRHGYYSLPFTVEAQCKKVKKPNKGKIDYLTLEGSIPVGKIDCTKALAKIFSSVHEQILANDEHPMKAEYLRKIAYAEEREQQATLRGIAREAEKIKPIKLKPIKSKHIEPE